ncbi:BglG family transcription antiterminator [Atopococcus tabaci]|uniref:BglG family transcription antiterminator n=1 Tax=Atopococcus tabaci TaxID=269774 RepID=UPI0004114EE3|nr:PRD domain-containing protein [Atopococcus tabaci]
MNERQRDLIHTLLYNVSPTSISQLQTQYGVSERTIKYDIATLRREFKKANLSILNKKGMGYYIPPEDKPLVLERYSMDDELEEKKQEDFTKILLYLLFVKDPANIKDIAQELYFSELSIKKFIEEGKEGLPENLTVQSNHSSDISLVGDERDIRSYYTTTLYEKLKKAGKQEISTAFQEVFSHYGENIDEQRLIRIEKTLNKTLNKWNVWISGDAYIHLFLHLYVGGLRMKNKIRFSIEEANIYKEFQGEYTFAHELFTELYWGVYDPDELLYLVEVMTDNNVFIDDHLEAETAEHLDRVLNKMTDIVNERYSSYKFNSDDFIQDVTPHLKQVLRRARLGIKEKPNPLFYQIKQNYQEFFSAAKILYRVFAEEFNLTYSEDEVSYLTIYLYKNISHHSQKKYHIYIVCGTGRGFSKLLKTRLTNIFDNIEVVDCVSSFHLLKRQKVLKADFIVSTIDLPAVGIPVIKISSFLGQEDVNKIQQLLDYGTQVSALPLPPKQTQTIMEEIQGISNVSSESAAVFSNLFLTLFNLMVDLPAEYRINQEKILGVTIHLIIALPRYFQSDFIDDDEEVVQEVIKIEKEHPIVSKKMAEFLELIENVIGKGIPYGERYALYQYIVNEGEQDESRTVHGY